MVVMALNFEPTVNLATMNPYCFETGVHRRPRENHLMGAEEFSAIRIGVFDSLFMSET